MDVLVSHNQTLLGKSIANVTAWNNFTEDETQIQNFADSLRASYANLVAEFLHPAWSLDNLTISFLDDDHVSYSIVVPFTSGPLVGTVGSDNLATQTALLISTSFIGPKPNRGRVYFAGLSESSLNSSQWTFSVAAEFRDMVLGWADGINVGSNTVFLRIMRRPSAVFPSYVSSPVTGAVVRSFPATQRRRRLGS
jgi:hypothetical protein